MDRLRNGLIALSLTLTAGCATKAADSPIAADDPETKTAIESMWNYSPEMAEACPQVLEYRVKLEPDGVVKDVELMSPNPLPASCGAAADSARRAIMKASPLRGTKGISALVLRFDSSKMRVNAPAATP